MSKSQNKPKSQDLNKIEQFRYDGYGSIFKYDHQKNAYLFFCKGNESNLKSCKKQYGKFI